MIGQILLLFHKEKGNRQIKTAKFSQNHMIGLGMVTVVIKNKAKE